MSSVKPDSFMNMINNFIKSFVLISKPSIFTLTSNHWSVLIIVLKVPLDQWMSLGVFNFFTLKLKTSSSVLGDVMDYFSFFNLVAIYFAGNTGLDTMS